MCYGTGARPPLPPISGGAGGNGDPSPDRVRAREHVLVASDGNRLAAFTANTDRPSAPGVVVLPDVRGLHPFYRDLALRFAEVGVHATATDYFGRTAGVGERGDDFDFMPHVERTHPDTICADVTAAVAHLRSAEGGGATSLFTVGFCFGGRNSLNQAARGHGLSGVIGFYGRVAPRSDNDAEAPVLLAPQYECPVLGLFGGADEAITREDVEAFRRRLDESGVDNEIVVYDGAPHSFFDRSFQRFQDESLDAWRRMLSFIERNASRSA